MTETETPALTAPPRAGEYRAIVSDPPWRYDNASTRGHAELTDRKNGKRKYAGHYKTMTIAEMKGLPVGDWAAPGCHLYLWTTTNFLDRAFPLMKAWGFEYVTNLVWVKPQMGMGNYFRVSHEHVLFGVFPPRERTRNRSTRSWFEAKRTQHSAKPESFDDLVEASSHPPYLDMFSRRQGRLNGLWDTWGLEAG